MESIDRRAFLRRGSAAVATAGVVVAMPTVVLPEVISALEGQAPALESTASATASEVASVTEPIVAHIRDLATGEIGILTGTREVILRDPQMAARLARAVK